MKTGDKQKIHPYDYDSWEDLPCYSPGSNSKLRISRREAGLCEWHAKTCKGEIKECPDCGYQYCEYHMPLHKK